MIFMVKLRMINQKTRIKGFVEIKSQILGKEFEPPGVLLLIGVRHHTYIYFLDVLNSTLDLC